MARKMNWALTPVSLAVIGAMDDFYDVYCTIQEIYENQRLQFISKYGEEKPLWYNQWDKLSLKYVRNVCEPLINKFLFIFTNDYEKVFANAYAFQTFSFINTSTYPGSGTFITGLKSFSEFLIELEVVISRIIHRWKSRDLPQYTFEQAIQEVNSHVETTARSKASQCELNVKTNAPVTDAVLYLFDILSSTSCYKNKHPVVSAQFIADLSTGTGRIALPVHYCNICQKHFVGTKTLSLFEKNYGKLIIEKQQIDDYDNSFEDFRKESKLHKLGYNVIDGQMTEIDRVNLLINLLEHKSISYLEVCSTLEQNIRLFQHSERHQLAVAKWKTDLKAVGNYVLQTNKTNSKT